MATRSRMVGDVIRHGALLAAWLSIGACGGPAAPARHAADVQPDDACAVCGMELSNSPGPRGQAWVFGLARPLMFDSTRDFFAYVLQPEHQSRLQDLFVQDTSRIDWQHPGRDAATFIDARRAVYVAWQPLPGSMGPTFAPFGNRARAEAFARDHGGAILAFDGVTLDLVAALDYRCPATRVAGGSQGAPPCRSPRATPVGPTVAAATRSPGAPAPPAPSQDR